MKLKNTLLSLLRHTLTTVGGSGHAKSKTLTVSTKVLEKGTKV